MVRVINPRGALRTISRRGATLADRCGDWRRRSVTSVTSGDPSLPRSAGGTVRHLAR